MPWKVVVEDPSAFIRPRHLPKDFIVVDPSKISISDARILLNFWFERQERGVRAFCFKAWYDGKEKAIVPAMSVNDKSKPSRKTAQESRHPHTQKRSLAKARNAPSSNEDADQETENTSDIDNGRPGEDDIDLLDNGGTARPAEAPS